MSRPILLALVFGGLVLPLAAQSSAEMRTRQDTELARLEKARDSLLQLWREARDLEVLQDSLEHAASVGRLDTIDVGFIRIITNPSKLRIREAAEAYWPVLDSVYGVEAERVRDRPLLLQATRPDTATRRGFAPRLDYWGSPVPDDTDLEGLINAFRALINIGEPDSALRVWLPGVVVPPMRGLTPMARSSYIALLTSRFEVGRRCFAGDMTSCRTALRIDNRTTRELVPTLTAKEQRYLAELMERHFRKTRNLSGLAECRAGSDTACTELLLSATPALIPPSFDGDPNRLLVHLALRAGGREAYRRLIADSAAPLAARLERASGMPIDTLIHRWYTTLMDARPTPVSLPIPEALVGVGWIVLLGYFGLRSSRWRMG